jgi:hypothetical protein
MDAAGQGALIGIGFMLAIGLTCYFKDKYEKYMQKGEHTHLVEVRTTVPLPQVNPLFVSKEKTSMRVFFKKNTPSSPLKTIQIS